MPNQSALVWHLQHNLYPPMGDWQKVAIEALKAMEEDEPDRWIDATGLVPCAEGRTPHVLAWQVVENLSLEDLTDPTSVNYAVDPF